MTDEILGEAKGKMSKSVELIRQELNKIRTGRANPGLLDPIQVDYYGAMTPLKQLAQISAPEPRMMLVQPFDAGSVAAIHKAIQAADMGLQPQIEGKMLRIPVPALTKERREELVKLVKKVAEDGRVSLRGVRRDANDKIKKMEKDKEITEDDREYALGEIQKLTDGSVKQIDELADGKEQELLQI